MNKRIILDKEKLTGIETNKFRLEEYFLYKNEKWNNINRWWWINKYQKIKNRNIHL